ncbi:DUF2242 domain-containing protein [Trinickia soli]|uniref:DUF2242 domain-containing protein n=1 Tax=Trinickia soli TaxID=380675 RepID=UPI001253C228|nr:DUF2242 domain-containing protein [Paraburkholderia sp. T12-10]
MSSSFRPARVALSFATFAALTVFAACSSAPQPKFQQELFDSGASPFSHDYNVGSNDACEAARRALLNQGYLTTLSGSDRIDATKDFQPNGDSHITVEVHVVCTPGEDADGTSIVYANAIQSGYALKKSDTSASVGLSLLGSVSLPIRSNSDAMVKISSETIQSHAFYDRFFESVGHYVGTLIKTAPVPIATVTTTTLPGSPPPVIAATAAVSAVTAPAPGSSVSAAPSPFGLASPYAPPAPSLLMSPATPSPTAQVTPAGEPAAPTNPPPAAAHPSIAQPAPAQAASQ